MVDLRRQQALNGLLLYLRLVTPYTLGVSLLFLTYNFVTPLALHAGPLTWPAVSRMAREAAASFWWILCFPGYAGGLLVHRWFQRGQEPFWWNLGLPLPLRLGTLWAFHALAALAWEVWVV